MVTMTASALTGLFITSPVDFNEPEPRSPSPPSEGAPILPFKGSFQKSVAPDMDPQQWDPSSKDPKIGTPSLQKLPHEPESRLWMGQYLRWHIGFYRKAIVWAETPK